MKKMSVWIDPRVYKITIAQARDYLTARGWRETPFPNPELLIFRCATPADDGTPFDLSLPAEEWMSSYPLRIEDLVGTVAQLENRQAADVITDMLGDHSRNGVHVTAPTRP